ncbi:efflux RND transporter periplasmic adaptor subunit [Hansschlegelia sp. KR7-227]|uniref:efflux RND transporter periplasmic adaptor subunit n=1 Tax=Hansschlegelia sp. KR7-227 TaxID=3400914 RepID=UPI003C085BCE
MPYRRSQKSSLLRVGALTILMLVLSGCDEPPPAAPPSPSGVRVQSTSLKRVTDVVTLTGAIEARVQSDLSFRFTGRIAARLVDVGDHVEAGQVLARLETSERDADVASAEAAVASAEATLKQAATTFERQKTLLEQGFTTRTSYDNANQALQAAQAGLLGAKSALGVAQDALANTELRADAAGVVTGRNGEAGQVVDVAQSVFTVARDGPRDAVFEVQESLVARPPAEATVEIALLADPAVKTTGKVREVAPAVNPASGTVRVKIGIDQPPPAMSLRSAVSGAGAFHPREVVTLPWTAFFVKDGKAAVWVVDPKTNVVSPKPVEVDSYRTGELLLRSGLDPNDLVVTAGGQLLRPGQVVAPTAEPASADSGIFK